LIGKNWLLGRSKIPKGELWVKEIQHTISGVWAKDFLARFWGVFGLALANLQPRSDCVLRGFAFEIYTFLKSLSNLTCRKEESKGTAPNPSKLARFCPGFSRFMSQRQKSSFGN
jgi:hypothetical protein